MTRCGTRKPPDPEISRPGLGRDLYFWRRALPGLPNPGTTESRTCGAVGANGWRSGVLDFREVRIGLSQTSHSRALYPGGYPCKPRPAAPAAAPL